jgi:Leucine-rich repeat (LRR) protein
MTNLESLVVHTNKLTGTVPTTISTMSSLRELWLNNNLLEGSVPTQLGSCPALSVVHLQDNAGIGGSLPAELGNLKSLGELENECLSRDNCLAVYLTSKRSSTLLPATLDVFNTSITGSIPEAVCALKTEDKLEVLSATCSGGLNCQCCTKCY